MPNFEAILILTILGVWVSIKVIRGRFMVKRGHMIQNGKRTFLHILQCSGFFWYTSCLCSKTLSFEAIKGQRRSASGQSFVLSFHLIYSMPSFSLIIMLPFLKGWRLIKVIRGQSRSMRGHMIQNIKKFVTYYVLHCSGFFWYTTCICSKTQLWGNERPMKVSLRSVIWP